MTLFSQETVAFILDINTFLTHFILISVLLQPQSNLLKKGEKKALVSFLFTLLVFFSLKQLI
jgi:uncharacterized membrane protein YqaE (UPF0057 family)